VSRISDRVLPGVRAAREASDRVDAALTERLEAARWRAVHRTEARVDLSGVDESRWFTEAKTAAVNAYFAPRRDPRYIAAAAALVPPRALVRLVLESGRRVSKRLPVTRRSSLTSG
jgi:hypothetical protein